MFTSSANASVAENADVTTVVYRAAAADAQNDAVRYSLGGADAARFDIDPQTGVVRLTASADFEAKASYDIIVVATDNGSPVASSSQAVSVLVTDVNEAPSFFAASRTVTIAENSQTSTVLLAAGASDPDADGTLRYSLAGADAATFAIDAETGAVTFRTAPDFEARAVYRLTLVATDQARLSASQAVTVTVTDVPEAAAQPNFYLQLPDGAAATVQGSGTVFGSATGPQQVTVRDTPGWITFDGSFNTGGDRILLSGPASGYTVRRSGATVQVSDGDTTVSVPVGIGGADLGFADGVRSLILDTAANAVRLGDQVLTSDAVVISAAAGSPQATAPTSPDVASYFLITAPGEAIASGNATVFGTITNPETVRVASGSTLVFDGSFNAGGDRVALPGLSTEWLAARAGATVTLTGPGGTTVSVPAGPVGMMLQFDDGDLSLALDPSMGSIRLGNMAVGASASAVQPPAAPEIAVAAFLRADERATFDFALPSNPSDLSSDFGLVTPFI